MLAGSSGLLPKRLYATAAPTEREPAPPRPPASERMLELSVASTAMVPLFAVTVASWIWASSVVRIQFSVIAPVIATLPAPAPVSAKDHSWASTLAPPLVPSVEALAEMFSQLVSCVLLPLLGSISLRLPTSAACTVTLPVSLVTLVLAPSTTALSAERMSLVATATLPAKVPAPAPAPAMTMTVGMDTARTTTSPCASTCAASSILAMIWYFTKLIEKEPATAAVSAPAAPMVTLTNSLVASALTCTEPAVEVTLPPSTSAWMVPTALEEGLALILREGLPGSPPM